MHPNDRKKHKNAQSVHNRSQRKPTKCNKSAKTNTPYCVKTKITKTKNKNKVNRESEISLKYE